MTPKARNDGISTKATTGRTKRVGSACSTFGKGQSGEVNRRAAVILDVLAGMRTPTEAADVLRITVARYYALERQALEALAGACRPQPKGRRRSKVEQQLAVAQRELERLRRECQRQAALVRATHRAVGLPAVPESSKAGKVAPKKGAKAGKVSRRRKRPTVRALRAAEALRRNSSGPGSSGALENGVTDPPRDRGSMEMERKESGDATSGTQTTGHEACGSLARITAG